MAERRRGLHRRTDDANIARRIFQAMFIAGAGLFVICLAIAVFGGTGRPAGQTDTAIGTIGANGGKPSCEDTVKYEVGGETYHVFIKTFAVIGSARNGTTTVCSGRPIGTSVAVDYAPFSPTEASPQMPDHRGQWLLLSFMGLLLAGLAAVLSP